MDATNVRENVFYLLGGAGYKNFGDELMVRGWLTWLQKKFPDEQVIVDGESHEKLSQTFSDDFANFSSSNLTNKLASSIVLDTFWDCVVRGWTFYDRGGVEKYKHLEHDFNRLQAAKVIHIHGGGYLNKHFRHKGFLLGIAAATALRSKAKLVATGIGFMPMSEPNREVVESISGLMDSFSLFETRDPESANFLQKYFPKANIISGLDDTFVDEINFSSDGLKRLHISWSDGRINDVEFSVVEDYVKKYGNTYDDILFWKCAPNDEAAWQRIRSIAPTAKLSTFDDLIKSPIPVSQADHMLTSRFHPHLIAARGGAVGGYYAHGNYYDIKHGSVLNVGSGFFPITKDTIDPQSFVSNKNTLNKKFGKYILQKNKIAEQIYL